MQRSRLALLLGAITLVVAASGAWALWSNRDQGPVFRTAQVRHGDLVATISATGTLEPQAAVDVGAQVQGVIMAFGTDRQGKEIN